MGGDLTIYLASAPIPGYLAIPSSGGPWPGVVVLHEAFGLNDDIRRITDRFAGLGYLALAPDLLARGRIRCLAEMAIAVQRGRGEAVQSVEQTVNWLRERADCTGNVGVAGFCLGGGLAFAVACTGQVQAAAPNYGRAPKPGDLARACPVVASYGGRDRVYRRHAAKASTALETAGIDHDIKVYPEAGHSFMNQAEDHRLAKALGRPLLAVGFDRGASEDAWRRIGRFLGRHLR